MLLSFALLCAAPRSGLASDDGVKPAKTAEDAVLAKIDQLQAQLDELRQELEALRKHIKGLPEFRRQPVTLP